MTSVQRIQGPMFSVLLLISIFYYTFAVPSDWRIITKDTRTNHQLSSNSMSFNFITPWMFGFVFYTGQEVTSVQRIQGLMFSVLLLVPILYNTFVIPFRLAHYYEGYTREPPIFFYLDVIFDIWLFVDVYLRMRDMQLPELDVVDKDKQHEQLMDQVCYLSVLFSGFISAHMNAKKYFVVLRMILWRIEVSVWSNWVLAGSCYCTSFDNNDFLKCAFDWLWAPTWVRLRGLLATQSAWFCAIWSIFCCVMTFICSGLCTLRTAEPEWTYW